MKTLWATFWDAEVLLATLGKANDCHQLATSLLCVHTPWFIVKVWVYSWHLNKRFTSHLQSLCLRFHISYLAPVRLSFSVLPCDKKSVGKNRMGGHSNENLVFTTSSTTWRWGSQNCLGFKGHDPLDWILEDMKVASFWASECSQ